MARLFISHSSRDNFAAVAIVDWLKREGWNDVFLDLDPEKGIAPGARWEAELHRQANLCEAVLFLVSENWLASDWCRREYELARKLNKRPFLVLIEDIAIDALPQFLKDAHQAVRLGAGADHLVFAPKMPVTHEQGYVTFSAEGLSRLKTGLTLAGLDPKFFLWPPEDEPNRAPYRGLEAMEAKDAGVFFGREAPVLKALDELRGLCEAAPPRLFVILGASGAGKSSFLRAGLAPRLSRDEAHFCVLAPIRPERAAISGAAGLLSALEAAAEKARLGLSRSQIRDGIESGALPSLLKQLSRGDERRTVVFLIDQAEELFREEAGAEAARLLELLAKLAARDVPPVVVLFAIRSDEYDKLQHAKPLAEMAQKTFSLSPMPRGSYETVIQRPAQRLQKAGKKFEIQPALSLALLEDVDASGGDALPLLAFTLQQLYRDHGGAGSITLDDYRRFGGLKGVIDAALARVFLEADRDSRIPRDAAARMALLRRGLIPWLAGIDPEKKAPRRLVARVDQIPSEARPLIDLLVEHRLLTRSVDEDTGEMTIEPAHEALLRLWGGLKGWLTEDFGRLATLEGVQRAAREWDANQRADAWAAHGGARLEEAERNLGRRDIADRLSRVDRDYLEACHRREEAAWAAVEEQRRVEEALVREAARKRRIQRIAGVIAVLAFVATVYSLWSNAARIATYAHAAADRISPKQLTAQQEKEAVQGYEFQECADCPKMIVIPAGAFRMGAPVGEAQRYRPVEEADCGADAALKEYPYERPLHNVTIAAPFAVAEFAATFDEWDACYYLGGCAERLSDENWGRGRRPVINVTWDQAKQYVAWLSNHTGKEYRLLTEAEWEYAARARTTTAFSWGDDVGVGHANCDGCGGGKSVENLRTAEVGSYPKNEFGLFDMHGNVWEWVEDCFAETYEGAAQDGSAATRPDCDRHVVRGGSWYSWPVNVRSAMRYWYTPGKQPPNPLTNTKADSVGFRVARTLRKGSARD